MDEIRLFSYKMTHDTGFAPNPFGGFITLATCKPKIRECKKIGDWIAGFTSGQLNNDIIGKEKLIYLMQITNKISFAEYWRNPEYEERKPRPVSDDILKRRGDNIYIPIVEKPVKTTDFKQLPNRNHNENNQERDLSGKYVLISKRFYYFGSDPIDIPENIRPKIPKGQSSHGVRTHNIEIVNKFISFIESKYQPGLYNHPHSWFKDDLSWKSDESYIES
jgi:hypothetical protein